MTRAIANSTRLSVLAPLTAFVILASACGDDSAGPGATSNDASAGDGGAVVNGDGGNNGNPDGSAGGDSGACDFNAFALGLVTSHTNGTDVPSTDLGDNCIDTHTLVPQATF